MIICFKCSNIHKTNDLYMRRSDIKGRRNETLNFLNIYIYIKK